MESPSQPDGVGERRRRREAERAAQLAAEQSGQQLTRRELRRQWEEEQARLAAEAGEPLPPRRGAHSAASAPSAMTADLPLLAEPVSRRSLRERLRAEEETPVSEEPPSSRTTTGRRPVVRTPTSARGMRTVDESGQLSGVLPVTRPATPAPPAPPAPQRTATPIPPASPTPAAPPRISAVSADPAAWESALNLPVVPAEPTRGPAPAEPTRDPAPAERPARAVPPAPHRTVTPANPGSAPSPPAPAAEQPLRPAFPPVTSDAEPSAPDDAASRPRWQAVGPRTPDRAATRAPEPPADAEEDLEDDDERPRNGVVTFVKYLLLIVAGIVIGVLAAALVVTRAGATEAAPAGAVAAPTALTPYDSTHTTPELEESSAR